MTKSPVPPMKAPDMAAKAAAYAGSDKRGRVRNTLDKSGLIVGLEQIQQRIGHSAGKGRQNGFEIAPVLVACPSNQAGCETIGTLHQEGQPGFGEIGGVGHVINCRTQACSHTAETGTQEQAGQGTHDIA